MTRERRHFHASAISYRGQRKHLGAQQSSCLKLPTQNASSSVDLNQKGFALVETTTSIVFISLVITSGLLASYIAFANIWLSRTAYEAAICIASAQALTNAQINAQIKARNLCEKDARDSISRALPVGKIMHFIIESHSKSARIELAFGFDGKEVIKISERQLLPLKSGFKL